MAEEFYYVYALYLYPATGEFGIYSSPEFYFEQLALNAIIPGQVGLGYYYDSDEDTPKQWFEIVDESTTAPSFSDSELEGLEGIMTLYEISYSSAEEQNLYDRFGGTLDLVDLSSAQAYVDSYMDDIVEQALNSTTETQFTNKRIRYRPMKGELSSMPGAEQAIATLNTTMTRIGEYS